MILAYRTAAQVFLNPICINERRVYVRKLNGKTVSQVKARPGKASGQAGADEEAPILSFLCPHVERTDHEIHKGERKARFDGVEELTNGSWSIKPTP